MDEKDTRESLIQAGMALFSRKGFSGTTVKDLADAAGVNVSLVSYHFGGKEGLFSSCLKNLGMERLAAAERILQSAESLEEFKVRLKMFVDEFVQHHVDHCEASRMIHSEADFEIAAVQDSFKESFLKVFETFAGFMSSAQKKGFLRAELDCAVVAGLCFGGLVNTVQKDWINEKYFGRTIKDPAYRTKVVDHIVAYCLYGCVQQA